MLLLFYVYFDRHDIPPVPAVQGSLPSESVRAAARLCKYCSISAQKKQSYGSFLKVIFIFFSFLYFSLDIPPKVWYNILYANYPTRIFSFIIGYFGVWHSLVCAQAQRSTVFQEGRRRLTAKPLTRLFFFAIIIEYPSGCGTVW